MFISLLIIFLLQVLSTAVNTLKTIFIVKGISKPAYLLTFIDALTFSWGMKLVVGGDGVGFVLSYAFGKVIGTYLGDVVEKKLAIGTLEITIMAKREKAIQIADHLRSLGYSVNTKKVFGMDGLEKYDVCLFIERKELSFLKDTLERLGFREVSMVITDISNVTGKIKTKRQINHLKDIS